VIDLANWALPCNFVCLGRQKIAPIALCSVCDDKLPIGPSTLAPNHARARLNTSRRLSPCIKTPAVPRCSMYSRVAQAKRRSKRLARYGPRSHQSRSKSESLEPTTSHIVTPRSRSRFGNLGVERKPLWTADTRCNKLEPRLIFI
jgi:hypothetical protein